MGIISLIGMLFGAGVAAPPDAMRLDATTETTLTARVDRVARLRWRADNLPTRLVAKPAINHAAENTADQRRDPEQPELRDRGAADDERRAGAARRIDRRVGHRNAHEINERQAQADRQRRKTRRRLAVCRAHDDEQKQHRHHDFHEQRRGQVVVAGRMVAVAVGRKAAGEIETRMTLGDRV